MGRRAELALEEIDFSGNGFDICKQLGRCVIRWEWNQAAHPPYRIDIDGTWLYMEFNDGFEPVDYFEYIEYFPVLLVEYRLTIGDEYLGFVANWPTTWRVPHSCPPWYKRGRWRWFIERNKAMGKMVMRNIKNRFPSKEK